MKQIEKLVNDLRGAAMVSTAWGGLMRDAAQRIEDLAVIKVVLRGIGWFGFFIGLAWVIVSNT